MGSRRTETSSWPLWVWPAVGSTVACGLGLLTAGVPLPAWLTWLAWPGGEDSAVALLQTIAGSVITVTALTFTLTVVALQLASQQFSPRLLRDFARDRVIKAVLTVLLSTLVFTATILREIAPNRELPGLGLLVAAVLGLAAVAAVLGFVNHMVRVLRVDTMMRTVHSETDKTIAAIYPGYDDPGHRDPGEVADGAAGEVQLPAASSGFVRMIAVEPLVRMAQRHDLVVRVEVRPGDQVVLGTPVGTAWCRAGGDVDQAVVAEELQAHVRLGYERTMEQDAAFGFRQLTDIAVKALSPSTNDPVTAAHAVGHLADLLVKLAGRRLGAALHEDSDGVGRVVVSDRDLEYYLELVCGPIRRYGLDEPTMLVALLRVLRDLAVAARDDGQREHIARQAALIVAGIPDSTAEHDRQQVLDLNRRVTLALHGDVRTAYADRSGETRST